VDPQCDFKGVEAHTMAANVTSRSKLERMHVTSSLSEALRDCSMVYIRFVAPSLCIWTFSLGTFKKNWLRDDMQVDDRPLHSRVAVECCAFLTHSFPICAFQLQSPSILQYDICFCTLLLPDFAFNKFLGCHYKGPSLLD